MSIANRMYALQERGKKGLKVNGLYKMLYKLEIWKQAYANIGSNAGAMTEGATVETANGMSIRRIQDIIELLKYERYKWTPCRRVQIPKTNDKMRPLGVPTWSDKLLQEVLRIILETYYEPKFSKNSYGFRPRKGCHTALREIKNKWTGTIWLIEGDISKCFEKIDHGTLIEILQRDISDGRFIELIRRMLKAGYMERWHYHPTFSGTPQGGVVSPLLANIYLNEMDKYVEESIAALYNRGVKRRPDPRYKLLTDKLYQARKEGDIEEIKELSKARMQLPSGKPKDEGYRRLRYVRYADDFIMGFIGPKSEAIDIKNKMAEYLEKELKLQLSEEKTLITHVTNGAKFLGYNIRRLVKKNRRKRTGNGVIILQVPDSYLKRIREKYTKKGKPCHRPELTNMSDYDIVQRYQVILHGYYQYYKHAYDVGSKIGHLKVILCNSMLRTLAAKYKTSTAKEAAKRRRVGKNGFVYYVGENKTGDGKIRTASFGGFSLRFVREFAPIKDYEINRIANYGGYRSQLIQRLESDVCELCGSSDRIQVHHVRKLDTPAKDVAIKLMRAMNRKTLVVCHNCHVTIHNGSYNGESLKGRVVNEDVQPRLTGN